MTALVAAACSSPSLAHTGLELGRPRQGTVQEMRTHKKGGCWWTALAELGGRGVLVGGKGLGQFGVGGRG